MPDEIKQVLGFDAGPALQALQQLDSAMAQFEARLGSSSQAFGSFNKSAGRTVAALIQISRHGQAAASALSAVVSATNASASGNVAANAQAAASAAAQMAASLTEAGNTSQAVSVKIGNALARVGAQSNQTANQVARNVQKMTVSLGLLSRIVFTQAIVRALSTLRVAFRQTLDEAIEFQRRLALITTIDNSGASIETLAGNVRSISEEFNIPLLETAAGLYQTISNQIGDAAESQAFLAETAQFARATGSDLKNSVDLLSGALKAYNLDISETTRVSNIFFQAIDLGRIEANELANSFGRVGPVAAELGLSLEETAAALSSITVRGSKTSEALTQLRAITTALLKPSVAMRETLTDLGFSSGEMAIKTLGLAGVLEALADSTQGSAAQMAALFPNVRGLAGAASLTSDNLKTLSDGIEQMQSAAEDFSKEKFLQATATDAEAVKKEINRLKNAFTVDLAQAVLKTTRDFLEYTGAVDKLIPVIREADTTLLGLVGTLTLVKAQSLATARGMLTLGSATSKALGAFSLVPLAFGFGESIGDFLAKSLQDARNATLRALEGQHAEELKLYEAKLKRERDAQNKSDEERLKQTRRVFQELNKIYLQDAANAKRANDTLAANTKASLDNILSTREKLIDELARTSAAAVDLANDARARIAAGRERTDDRNFDREFAQVRGQSAQIEALLDRSKELAARAAKELKAGSLLGDPDRIAEAVRQFDKAQSIGEKALQIAGKNRFFQNEVYSDLEQLTARQRRAEEELIKAQERRQKALDEERKKQQAVVNAMRDQLKIALENTGIFDEQGNQFDAQEQARRDKARRDALKSIAEAALNQDDLSATAALGLADFVSRFENELARDPIRLQFTVENEITRIRNQMEAAFANFKIGSGVDVAGLEQVLGRQFTTPDQLAEGLEEATKRAAELRLEIDKTLSGGEKATQLRAQLASIVEQLDAARPEKITTDNLRAGQAVVDVLREQVAALTNSTSVSEEELEALRSKFLAFVQLVENQGGIGVQLFLEDQVEKLGQAFVKLQELKKLQAQSTVDPGLQSQLSQLEAVLAKQPGTQFANSAKAISSAAGPSAAIAAAWERAADAAERAAAAAARVGSGVRNQAFGGMMHLASGGATRGIDTIPAMLSPGEFVMNARSSRKFYAQLQAMNAGLAPTFRENGGSVTNVGDIHIAVNGGQTATQTIREIGRGLRREIRRGTLDL